MNENNHAGLMDSVYRSQRHIYDLTRKYYLLGRDQLISDLIPHDGADVLEVGCGTGRNLILAARKYPRVKFYGFDISEEMLITARKNVEKSGLSDRICLAKGDASNFSVEKPFETSHFDQVFYSYTLSMIPPWQSAIEQGVLSLKEKGSLHIVDFGQQEKLPILFKKLLQKWLAAFHVSPRANLKDYCVELTKKHGLDDSSSSLYRGYALKLRISKNI